MTYNKFTMEDLETKFNLNVIKKSWLSPHIPPFVAETILIDIIPKTLLYHTTLERIRTATHTQHANHKYCH